MVELIDDNIRVRCMECKTEHFLKLELKSTIKEARTMGYEYQHEFYNDPINCNKCNEEFKLNFLVYEYPKGFTTYIDIGNEGCLEMENKESQLENIKAYDEFN